MFEWTMTADNKMMRDGEDSGVKLSAGCEGKTKDARKGELMMQRNARGGQSQVPANGHEGVTSIPSIFETSC